MTGQGLHHCLFVPQALLLNPSCWPTRCLHLPSTPRTTCLPSCNTPWLRILVSRHAAIWLSWCTNGIVLGWDRGWFCVVRVSCLGRVLCRSTLRAHPAAVGVDVQQQQLACWGSCRGCLVLLRAILFPACATLLLVVSGVQARGPRVLCFLCWAMGRASRLLPFFGLRGREVAWGVSHVEFAAAAALPMPCHISHAALLARQLCLCHSHLYPPV